MASPIFLTPLAPHSPVHAIIGLAILAVVCLAVMFGRRRPVSLIYGWGEVYVFQDVENPRLFKIGMTRRATSVRMREVSDTMTGGAKLQKIYGVKVPYVATVEMLAHANLKGSRHWSERGTEWFKTDARSAIKAVDRAVREVRMAARQKRKWSPQADATATRWRLTRKGPVTEKIF